MIARAQFFLQRNFETCAEKGQMHECAGGVCLKMILHEGNNIVMTSHLIFMCQGILLIEQSSYFLETSLHRKWFVGGRQEVACGDRQEVPSRTSNMRQMSALLALPKYVLCIT
jgi:hypothetical protein